MAGQHVEVTINRDTPLAIVRLRDKIMADVTLVFALCDAEWQIELTIQRRAARNAGDLAAAIIIGFIIVGDDFYAGRSAIIIQQSAETDALIAVDFLITSLVRGNVRNIASIASDETVDAKSEIIGNRAGDGSTAPELFAFIGL